MIDVSNENLPGCFLFLEMAFQTERRVAFIQQPLIDGAMRGMAYRATLAHCLMLVHERTALLCMTLEAGFISAQERKATGFERLLNVCRCALGCDPFVRLMAIAAAHLAFQHGMVMRQCERRANIQVALETGVRRLSGIDDRARPAAGFHVQTAGSVARLAANVLCVLAFCLQPGVSGGSKIAYDLFVTGCAFL